MQLSKNLKLHRWLVLVAYVILLLAGAILDLKLADFSCKKKKKGHGKYFRFCRPLGVHENCLALLWYQESSHRQLTYKRMITAVVPFNSVYTNRQLAAPVDHSLPTTVLDYRAFILDLEFRKPQNDRKCAF